jgi:hypothetical protein
MIWKVLCHAWIQSAFSLSQYAHMRAGSTCHVTSSAVRATFLTVFHNTNLPIAHRLTGFSTCNATLARTIYTVLTVSEKKFHVLPACKHGCMFAGALNTSRMGP